MSDTKKFDLAYALKLAEYWHRNQFIGHLSFVEAHTKPVIENVACALTNEDPVYDQQLLIVAALHDIIDNSDCPLSELDCFGATIKEAVKAISKHSPNESLDRYLARISTNKLAFMVKGQEALVNLERALLTRSPKDTRKYSELLARLFEIVEGKSPAAKEHNADNGLESWMPV